MQTVITWTRYDGTPETLPPVDTMRLVRMSGDVRVRAMALDICGWREGGKVYTGPRIGDWHAPWPAAPQGVE